ncbi:MAG: hypothetical protein JO089_02650 [Alphaproteobacteria bacterium]|nr:hypothetical protein [Alphaproteobacteria bacterium]
MVTEAEQILRGRVERFKDLVAADQPGMRYRNPEEFLRQCEHCLTEIGQHTAVGAEWCTGQRFSLGNPDTERRKGERIEKPVVDALEPVILADCIREHREAKLLTAAEKILMRISAPGEHEALLRKRMEEASPEQLGPSVLHYVLDTAYRREMARVRGQLDL